MSTEDKATSSGLPAGSSAATYGDAERLRRGAPLIVYEFEQVDKLLQGWQVHVVTQRLIHEDAARRIQTLHYGLGGPAVILAALAGSSAVAAWGSGAESDGLRHTTCGTALEARWWCPTCSTAIGDEEASSLRYA